VTSLFWTSLSEVSVCGFYLTEASTVDLRSLKPLFSSSPFFPLLISSAFLGLRLLVGGKVTIVAKMPAHCFQLLKCTVLPVGKVVLLSIPQYSITAIQCALSKETRCAAEGFVLFAKKNERLVALTPESEKPDSVYALLRCRGGGKGGFRKQLEKKGREFARAKMKEKRNNAKTEVKKDDTVVVKKKVHVPKPKLTKPEASAARTLVKQGLAFVLNSVQKGEATS
jgi:hypothetical protein